MRRAVPRSYSVPKPNSKFDRGARYFQYAPTLSSVAFDHIAFDHIAFDHIAFDHITFDHIAFDHIALRRRTDVRQDNFSLFYTRSRG